MTWPALSFEVGALPLRARVDFLVDTEHQHLLRVAIQLDDIANLIDDLRVSADLELIDEVGLSPNAAQIRPPLVDLPVRKVTCLHPVLFAKPSSKRGMSCSLPAWTSVAKFE
jgi:hypothetical protein